MLRKCLIIGLILCALPLPGQTTESDQTLSPRECRLLYRHQLEVAQADADNPLAPALQVNADVMQRAESEQAALAYCLRYTTRESMYCQARATTLLGILTCQQEHDRKSADRTDEDRQRPNDAESSPTNTDATADSNAQIVIDDVGDGGNEAEAETEAAPIENQENPVNETNGEASQSGTNENERTRTDALPSGKYPVNDENCEKSYAHVFQIITATKTFKEHPDHARLQAHWLSVEARAAYQRRCLAEFRPEDLGCLLGTNDPEVIQGCLLIVNP